MSTAPFQTGDLLDGRWPIRSVLHGAMGTVLILDDPSSGARLAAKTPRPDRPLDDATRHRFEVEARTWLSLGRHENVVEALFLEDVATPTGSRPFLFLEYVDGPTLETVLVDEDQLGVGVALDIASGIAWGMAHAHGEGRRGARIVHRDLKPENVFLTRERVVKVSDFGIARALDRDDDVADAGAGLGTPFFAAPEQMKDARTAGLQSDVYAYGALVHQLLTGAPPFPADTLSQLVWRVLRERASPPSSLRPGLPVALDELVLACLEKSPGDRPSTFMEVLGAISAIRGSDEIWLPPDGARSCPSCGWMTVAPRGTCSICGTSTTRGVRYAPAAQLHPDAHLLGSRESDATIVVERFTARPRMPRAGEETILTVRVGNPGSAPLPHVLVPYDLPDRNAFVRVTGHRRAFRGTVPPTALDAPLRLSWAVRPLREGQFVVPAPRVSYRGSDGERVTVTGESLELVVAPQETAALVGREAEIASLRAGLVDTDVSSTMLLLGRFGMGKSRLAREVRQLAAADGARVARGRCLDRGVAVRGALKEALRQLLRLRGRSGTSAEIAAALVDLLGDAVRSEPSLLDFLVAELSGRPLPRGESPSLMWSRCASVLGRERPLLIVLEDVQRDMDVASIAVHMALAAARDGSRVSILLTGRPSLADTPSGQRLIDRLAIAREELGTSEVLALAPLPAGAVRRLVDTSFHPNDFSVSLPWLYERISTLSGGNPLLVTELVRALRGNDRAALLETRDGRWTAHEGATREVLEELVPPRVEELVVARLATLPAATRQFVEAAGILGDVFETHLLQALLPPDAELDGPLGDLEREGVLREVAGTPPRIRFREPLLPEVLARALLARDPAEFAALHGRAADEILAHGQPESRDALRLARHLAAAGRPVEAVTARLAAARRLADRQAYRQAARVLDDAETLLSETGIELRHRERIELRLLEGEVRRFSGDLVGAADAYQRLVEGVDGQPSEDVLATVFGKLGKVNEGLGHLDEALYCYAVGLSLREENSAHADVPMSLVNLAGLHDLRGEHERAEHYLARAIASAELVGSARALGRAHAIRARQLVARGEAGAARTAVRDALRWSRKASDRRATATAWNVLGIANHRSGRPRRALRHFLRALHLRQESGDLPAVAASWNNVGAVREDLGDRMEALGAYERAVEIYRRVGSRRGLGVALSNVGRLRLDTGAPAAARDALVPAVEALRVAGDPVGLSTALAVLAQAELAMSATGSGGAQRVADLLAEAVEQGGGRGDHESEADVAAAAADARAAMGDIDGAVARLRSALGLVGLSPGRRVDLLVRVAELDSSSTDADEAVRIAGEGSPPWTRAAALAAQGRLRLRSGDPTSAAGPLRRAAGLLRSAHADGPLLLNVLADLERAEVIADPDAAAAAGERARELRAELLTRGYVAERLG